MKTLKDKLNSANLWIPILAIAGLISKIHFIFGERYITGDGAIYLNMAKSLAAGDWSHGLGDFQGPMLPLLTALFSKLGIVPHHAILLVNSLLASVVIFPFARLLRTLRLPDPFILASCACLIFYPRWYQYSTLPLTEVLFGTLLIFIADSLKNEVNLPRLIWLAFLTAATYLTKSEGLLLLPILLAALIINALAFRTSLRHTLLHLSVYIALTLLFALPYLLHLKSLTGDWALSPKAWNAALQGSTGNADAFRFALDSAGNIKASPHKDLLSYPDRINSFKANLPIFWERMPKTIVWPLFICWGLGLLVFFFRRKTDEPNPAFAALWIFSVVYLLLYPFFFISFRFYVPYIPLALLFAAYLIFSFVDLSRLPFFDWIAVIFTGVLIYLSWSLAETERLRSPLSRGDAGAWTAANLKNEKIMALHGGDLGYYFGLPTIQLPYAAIDEIYQYARTNNIRYLLLGAFDLEEKDCKRPQLRPLFEGKDSRFVPEKSFVRGAWDRYMLLRVNLPVAVDTAQIPDTLSP